jgi:hypothetical protein
MPENYLARLGLLELGDLSVEVATLSFSLKGTGECPPLIKQHSGEHQSPEREAHYGRISAPRCTDRGCPTWPNRG